jgi:hypothetical protein
MSLDDNIKGLTELIKSRDTTISGRKASITYKSYFGDNDVVREVFAVGRGEFIGVNGNEDCLVFYDRMPFNDGNRGAVPICNLKGMQYL